MVHAMLRIAVLGAPRTGKTRLATELSRALAQPAGRAMSISDGAPLLAAIEDQGSSVKDHALACFAQAHRQQYDLTLLMGLDLPRQREDGATARAGESVDAALRAALGAAGVDYKVIYGRGPQRLENALLAIEGAGAALSAAREAAQYGLQGGRVAWRCENCSDPDCEHRLFSGLLR